MNYSETIEYIHSIPKFSRTLGNDLLRKLLNELGEPQDSLRFVHIGGTNGKGSTSTMLSEILIKSGYKVGLFTSPYLVRFNERIRINGTPITDEDLADTASYVRKISENKNASVSEFAFDLAVALMYFKAQKCDVVILEVGLGGRLDATNIIEKPLAIGLTAIGLDHCQYLGDTVDKISQEKLGIVKPNCDVVLYPLQEEVVFKNSKEVCENTHSSLTIPDLSMLSHKEGLSFIYKSQKYALAMIGKHQIYNAITAIEIAEILKKHGFDISDVSIKSGIKNAKINGRMEFLSDTLCLDGAHNPQAIKACLKTLNNLNREIYFVIALMEDKACSEIVGLISDYVKENGGKVYATDIDMPRCLKSGGLSDMFSKHGIQAAKISSENNEIYKLSKSINDDKLVCILGSLYLVGKVKSHQQYI